MNILISLWAGHLSPRDATLGAAHWSRNVGWAARQLPSTLLSSTRSKQAPLLTAEEEDRDDIGCADHQDALA
jgi:hypothetical protein